MELINLIDQIGSPTLFFTLSAADTKWPDLHRLFANETSPRMLSNRQWMDNIINNPHTVALYMHHRFTILCEEVIEKLLGVKKLLV